MARSHTPRTRYSTPLAMLAPLEIRPLRDQSMLLVGDLSTIFGIELIEPAARAAAVSHDAMDAFVKRAARQPAHSAPKPAPAAAPGAEPSQTGADVPSDAPAAVAAWKALPEGAIVTCARGRQWTAKRPGGRLTFSQVMPSGRPGKTVDQPWVPLIMARLPVWPVPFIGEPDPQQGAPAAPAPASARTSSASTRWNAQEDDDLRREWGAMPLDEIAERHRRTVNGIWCRARTLALAEPAGGWDSRDASRPAPLAPLRPAATSPDAPLGVRPAKNQPPRPAATSPDAPLGVRPAKNQPPRPPVAASVAAC